MPVVIKFCTSVPGDDPENRPCTIVGKRPNLDKLPFTDVALFLGNRVSEEAWKAAVSCLSTTNISSCGLWLNKATVGGIPTDVSRHNTPSRAHALTKVVQSEAKSGENVAIIVVCEHAEMLASGCGVARGFPNYSMKTNSTSDTQAVSVGFILVGEGNSPVTEDDVKCLDALAEGVRLAQDIVDKPCNFMHTDAFLDVIRDVGTSVGIEPLIIQGEELDEQGFGGIYGVGKAAIHQPALAVLSHTPLGATETICWAGKGIVYDTGGFSIKSKTAMPGMKRDCGGAAGILGAFLVALKMGFCENLHAVFCLAENSVGPTATRPDDIHTLYSGKTVEINDTDAEGRLVLGDGVAYARKVLNADWILDMATLTGAQGISTGRYHAGVVTNHEPSQVALQEAGRTSGDLTFPLPYSPELHFGEFKSIVADMKNAIADPSNAQSSCGGLFIGSHIGFDYPGVWIHIDTAYPNFTGERATGYGVALLTTLYGDRTQNPLLRASAPNVKRS